MYWYNNEMPPKQGWICPKCGRVNAPWLPCCDCVRSQTTGIGYTLVCMAYVPSEGDEHGNELLRSKDCSYNI